MLLELAEFVHENNYFEFGMKIIQRGSGTVIGTKFAPRYTSMFMINFERVFKR